MGCWRAVLVRVGAALDAGLGLRIAVQTALYELALVLDLVQLGVDLARVDRSHQEQTCPLSAFLVVHALPP